MYEIGEMNSLLTLTGFKPSSLTLQGNNQVVGNGREPVFLLLKSYNCKAYEDKCKMDTGDGLSDQAFIWERTFSHLFLWDYLYYIQ